jgi:carboxypeptidase Q
MRAKKLFVAATAVAIATSTTIAQEKIDTDMVWKIRREAMEHSQIFNTLHILTDVYGPRLTGSPNAKAAGEWVAKRATEWGLKNAHLEPCDFGHAGWLNERTSAFIVSPVKDSLVAEALAWTPGTNLTVTAAVVQIDPPARLTKEQLTAYFDANRANVKGKIVMFGPPSKVPVTIIKPSLRRDDAELRAQFATRHTNSPSCPRQPVAARRDIIRDLDEHSFREPIISSGPCPLCRGLEHDFARSVACITVLEGFARAS